MDNKDIELLTDFILGDSVPKMLDMIHENERLHRELQRKDNIINAIKEELKQEQEYYRYRKDNRYRAFLSNILDKINELERGNK